MKTLIQKLVDLFGYKVMKIKSTDATDLDDLTKSLITKSEPVIFDVGANKGQSITRYKKLFQNPIKNNNFENVMEWIRHKYGMSPIHRRHHSHRENFNLDFNIHLNAFGSLERFNDIIGSRSGPLVYYHYRFFYFYTVFVLL